MPAPSDELPDVLATGRGDTTTAFVSLSARASDGRDEDYLIWHALDHRPEQYRLDGLRGSLRVVSTPACRAARAASSARFDAVDHVMTYLFAERSALPPFAALGAALHAGGRMPVRLPAVETGVYEVAGKAAAPRVAAGADVIPWRPARGVYLIIEEGAAPAAHLVDVPGVAGVWWCNGVPAPAPFRSDTSGLQITYAFVDGDPVAVASGIRPVLDARWSTASVSPLLAAPFHTVVEHDWGRYLP